MAQASTRYVRLRDRERDLARLRKDYTVEDGGEWAVIVVASPSFEPEDLAALSSDFGEALSLQLQTIADLVIYDHFAFGRQTRGLTYAGEAGWIRAVGDPEPWEAKCLFTQVKLNELVDELEADSVDAADAAREIEALQKLWAGGRIVENETRPPADGRAIERAVARHFGFPIRK
jgi:hypothetical protein